LTIFGTPQFALGAGPFTSTSQTAAFNTAVGDAIVVFAAANGGSTMACSDLAGNSYTAIGSVFVDVGGTEFNAFQTIATVAMSSNKASVHNSSGSMRGSFALNFGVTGGTAAFDVKAGGVISSSSNPLATPSFNTSGADEVVGVGIIEDAGAGGATPQSGFTVVLSGGSFFGDENCSWGAFSSTQTGITGNISFGAPGTGVAIAVAFKAAGPATFSVSGNAGTPGATVSYTGTSSGSTTADGSGNYSITGLANGSYTVTPSKAGFSFTPTNASETVSGSNITGVDFTATPSGSSASAVVCIMQ
jgi:hypothetical protein